jgi:hypothetical protein
MTAPSTSAPSLSMVTLVFAAGVIATTVPTIILSAESFGFGDVVIQLLPFIVLASVAHVISRPAFVVLLALLVVGTVGNQIAVHTSEGSTSSIALLIFPLLLLGWSDWAS